MFIYVLIALIGGLLITLSRIFNAQLGEYISPFETSLCVFGIGSIFMVLILLVRGEIYSIDYLLSLNPLVWLTAPVSLGFLALAVWTFPKLGATKTTILIIAGQMLSAEAFSYFFEDAQYDFYRLAGIAFIVIGTVISHKTLDDTD